MLPIESKSMSDSDFNLLGISEAADIAGCSRDTIRRAAQKEELVAEMGPGPRGPQWWIREDALRDWMDERQTYTPGYCDDPPTEQVHSRAAHAEQAEATPSSACASSAGDTSHSHIHASVHQAVVGDLVEQIRRADRQVIALQLQLNQERKLLAENAESLIQQEAESKRVEAIISQVEEEKLELAAQAEQAAQAAEQAKQEAQAVAAQLKQARAELAQWQEERKRPWWKRVFNTG